MIIYSSNIATRIIGIFEYLYVFIPIVMHRTLRHFIASLGSCLVARCSSLLLQFHHRLFSRVCICFALLLRSSIFAHAIHETAFAAHRASAKWGSVTSRTMNHEGWRSKYVITPEVAPGLSFGASRFITILVGERSSCKVPTQLSWSLINLCSYTVS